MKVKKHNPLGATELSFLKWKVIGAGSERTCYQIPDVLDRCLKVSRVESSKQTAREINYFKRLKKRKVPFNHLPKFYSYFSEENYIGIEQELVENIGDLSEYLLETQDIIGILKAFNELRSYLKKHNIIPSDLVLSNILVSKKQGILKFYIIDGFGSTEFIPISEMSRLIGRRKIDRKCDRFLKINLGIFIKEKLPELYDAYNKIINS